MAGPDSRSQQSSAAAPDITSTLALTGIPASLTEPGSGDIMPFPAAGITGATAPVTATITVSDVTVAQLDIAAFDSAEGRNPLIDYGYGSTVQGQIFELDITGSAADVSAALHQVALGPTVSQSGGIATETIGIVATSGSDTTSASVALTIDREATNAQPAYVSNTGSDLTGTVFTVSGDQTQTAAIVLTGNHQAKIVFGGNAALDLTADNAVVVLNGANQNGAVHISSLGGNQVWLGSASVDYVADGHTQFILGDEAGTSSTLSIQGGLSMDVNEIDVWGDASETQSVTTDGRSQSVVFTGGANLDFNGANAVIVSNGSGQTGNVSIQSQGGNTVWAGHAALGFSEGVGNDAIILTGAANTTVYGASEPVSGTTSVHDIGNTGEFIDDGGAKAARLDLGGGQNTVFGGAGSQAITMNGSGSLTIADGSGASGAQTVSIGSASTGDFAYWGGGNAAAITLGGGASFVQAGTGNASLTGGSGAATIDLGKSVAASLTVDGAHDGNIDVFGFAASRASASILHVESSSVRSGNLVVMLADGATATFHGISDPSHVGIVLG